MSDVIHYYFWQKYYSFTFGFGDTTWLSTHISVAGWCEGGVVSTVINELAEDECDWSTIDELTDAPPTVERHA